MRILLANDEIGGAGGVETYLDALVAELQNQGHEIGLLYERTVISDDSVLIPAEHLWRVSVRDEGLDGALTRVHRFEPDVCFSHNMGALDVDEGLVREWPVVKMMHGHFGTCISGHKAFALPQARACTRDFGPGCLAHYLPRRCGPANPLVMLKQYTWSTRQRELFDRYAAIVVASRFMRDEYVRAGVSADRIAAIPLFTEMMAPRSIAERSARITDVLFLGRMTPLKGPDVLMHAIAAHVPDARVTFAGEGPERPRLQQLAASLGVRAQFPGWVSGASRDALLADAAILAVPSVWPEPFGLVGLEAATFGTPAVAFDTGGISEWLTDGVNGRLVAPDRGAAGLGETIAALLKDADIWRQLSAGAREVSERFTIRAHVGALELTLARAARGSLKAQGSSLRAQAGSRFEQA
jgi:glycosyltransferase involved in cell wall biosynthesis